MMTARAGLFLSALVMTCAAGCKTTSTSRPPEVDFTVSKTESVVVMGVSPVMRLRAYQGFNEGKEWEQNKLAEAVINAIPDGGYVVVRMAPSFKGEGYGIMRVIPSLMNVLSVCTGGSTAVFDVPPDSVVYIGDFTLTEDGEYKVHVGYDFDKALSYLKKTYPGFKGPLAKGRAKVAKVTNGQCDGKPVTFVAK
jgi:hypothetical protein